RSTCPARPLPSPMASTTPAKSWERTAMQAAPTVFSPRPCLNLGGTASLDWLGFYLGPSKGFPKRFPRKLRWTIFFCLQVKALRLHYTVELEARLAQSHFWKSHEVGLWSASVVKKDGGVLCTPGRLAARAVAGACPVRPLCARRRRIDERFSLPQLVRS